MGWNRSSESGRANTPGSPHVGQPKFALRSKGGGTAHGKSPRPRWLRGAVAALIVVIGAGIAAWYFWPSAKLHSENVKPLTPVSRIAEVKPSAAPAATNTAQKVRDPHEGYVLSPAGVWQPTNRPWRADAKKVHAVHTNWSHSAKGKVPYRNAVEQMLLATFSCPLGECPPPYLRIPQSDMKRLVEILIDKPSIDKDDSAAQIKNKQLIAAAKKEMAEFIRKGGKPEQFFKAYHDQLQKAYEKRSAAIREVSRLVAEEGDSELARDFQDEMNKRFKKEGIRPIHIETK